MLSSARTRVVPADEGSPQPAVPNDDAEDDYSSTDESDTSEDGDDKQFELWRRTAAAGLERGG